LTAHDCMSELHQFGLDCSWLRCACELRLFFLLTEPLRGCVARTTIWKSIIHKTKFEILVVLVKTSFFGLIQTWISTSWGISESSESLVSNYWKNEVWKSKFWARQIERDISTREVPPKLLKIRTRATHRKSQQIIPNNDRSNTMLFRSPCDFEL
jgi:hypothetical protein